MSNLWPLHPPPYPNESLSSWIARIAHIYHMYFEDFLIEEFGINAGNYRLGCVDFDPPQSLLTKLSENTGFTFDAIMTLTAQVYTPLLVNTFKAGETNSFDKYVNKFRIFPGKRKKVFIFDKDWVPWSNIQSSMFSMCCRLCISEDIDPYLRLHWRFSWMVTCPKHKTLLEPAFFHRTTTKSMGCCYTTMRYAPITSCPIDALCAMDNITLQAVTKGFVEVPSGTLDGGIWLRILRSLIEELSFPENIIGQENRLLMVPFWEELDIFIHESLEKYELFEKCDHKTQLILMSVASLVIKAIFSRKINFFSNGVKLLTMPVI